MIKLYIEEIKSQKQKIAVTLSLILVSYSIFFFLPKSSTNSLTQEDGLIESLTAFFFISSSIIFFFSNPKRNFFLYFLALFLFFGAGEEISWGQRILGFKTPKELNDVNVQGETTLHNIEIFNRENFNKTYKSGIKNLITIDNLYRMFIVTFGFLLPFLAFHLVPIKKIMAYLKMPIPPITIGFFFVFTWFVLKLIPTLVGTDADTNMDAPEVFEFTTSFIWFMISLYFFTNRNRPILGTDIKNTFS